MTDQKQEHSPSTTISTNTSYQQPFPYMFYDDENSIVTTHCTSRIIDGMQDTGNTSNSDTTIALKDRTNIDMTRPHPSPQLPNEIIVQIIDHVIDHHQTIYECTFVNKQFHLITNPLIWHTVHLCTASSTKKFVTYLSDAFTSHHHQRQQQRLSILGQYIQELTLTRPYWTDTLFLQLLPHTTYLKRLCLHPTRITDAGFQQLPHSLTSLKLNLVPLTRTSFSAIGQHCHQLCDFEWTLRNDQSPEWLEMLLDCPLERLVLTSSDMILNEKSSTIIKSFHQLTCLEITHGHSTDTTASLLGQSTTNDGVVCWPRLTNLTLNPCTSQLDDATLIEFIRSHPHLQQLHMRNATTLTNRCLDAIGVWLPKLTHLTLTDNIFIDPVGIRRFICQCNYLEILKFDSCRFVDMFWFPEVMGLCGKASKVQMDSTAMEIIRQKQMDIRNN